MRETWKDYLAPSILAAGLFSLLIGVAVFGAPGYEREANRSYVTEDDSQTVIFSSDETVEKIFPQEDRLDKPASTNCEDMCAWNTKLKSKINPVTNYRPEQVPQVIAQFTNIKESDGAFYFYSLGYLYDDFSRRNSEHRQANYSQAVKNYQRAIQLDRNVAYYHHFLGQTHYFYAKNTHLSEPLDAAIESYRKAAELDPAWPMPFVMQGWALVEKSDRQNAYRLFKEALKLDPCCPTAISDVQRLRVLLSGPDWQKIATTEKDLLPVAEEKPSAPAKQISEEVISTEAQTVQATRVGVPETRDSYELDRWTDGLFALVKNRTESFEPEEVKKIIDEQTDLKESDGAFYYFAVGYLHDRFVRQSKVFRKSNYVRSVENYTKAIERDDSVALFYHFRGQVNYFYALYENEPEFYDKAVEDYIAAEKSDPKWPMPVDMQGWVALQRDDCDAAIVHLERALEIDLECLDALNCLVSVCVRKSNQAPNDMELIQKGLNAVKRLHTLLKEGKKFGSLTYVPWYAKQLVDKLKQVENISLETHPEYFMRQDKLNYVFTAITNCEYETALKMLTDPGAKEESIYFYSTQRQNEERLDFQEQYYKVICLYELERYEEAMKSMPLTEAMEKFANFVPNRVSIFNYHVNLLTKLERYQEIVDGYETKQISLIRDTQTREHVDLHRTHALFALGRNDEAIESFSTKLLRFTPNQVSFHFDGQYLSDIFLRTRDNYLEACSLKASRESRIAAKETNSGTQRLLNYLNLRRNNNVIPARFYLKAADALAFQKDYANAIQCYERYCHYCPNEEQALLAWLVCLQNVNRNDERAVQVATRLITIAPENPDYWIERAFVQSENRSSMSGAVLHDLTRAIELLESQNVSGNQLKEAYANRAEVCSLNDRLLALSDYMKVIAMASPGEKIENIRVETFKHANGLLICDAIAKIMQTTYSEQDKIAIISYCTQLLKAGADERLFLGIRAYAYQVTRQYQKAIDDYTVVVGFEPSEKDKLSKVVAYNNMGQCYDFMLKYDKAIECYTLALEENPNDIFAYQGRSSAYNNGAYRFTENDPRRQEYLNLAEQDRKKLAELQKQQQ